MPRSPIEVIDDLLDTPPHVLKEHEELRSQILQLRIRGCTSSHIAKELRVSERRVGEILKGLADDVRNRHTDVADELFMLHQARLEWWIQKVTQYIESMQSFDDRVFRVAIQLLDRQSKLLGLDKTPQGSYRRGDYDWLEKMTPTQLVAECKRLEIPVPKKFELEAEELENRQTSAQSASSS